MLRNIFKLSSLLLLMAGSERASAFSLLGEFETWQQPVVNFRVGGQLGGTRNIGDEFRLNTPVITYGFDFSFLDYFGANGVRAVDEAFKILNNLPRVSRASSNLTEFLTDDAIRTSASAEALNLVDMKSATLSLMMEQMGLYGEEHVFDLRQRSPFPGTCQFDYTVIVRNFDPVTYEPSHYVNGTLYSYEIVDACPALSRADAFETLVDPTDIQFNAVATFGVFIGGYYLNLTRDDFGGLRYLYRKNNYNNETLPPDAVAQAVAGAWQPVDFFTITNIAGTNFPALRGGIEKIRFKKARFDSQLGTIFRPTTFSYSLPFVTNSTIIKQNVRRVTFRPDILFTAADIAPENPSAVPWANPLLSRSISFATNVPPFFQVNNSGPGTILPQKIITFNKIGPFFENQTPFFLDEATAIKGFLWGSFDGSTNDPIVYPQGTSIRDIEAQVLRN